MVSVCFKSAAILKVLFGSVCSKRFCSSAQAKQVMFSGIQPTGVLHLGNYFGAVEKWLECQDKKDLTLYVSVVDYHALTSGKLDPKLLRQNILNMTASLLACGLDTQKLTLFQQSLVPEHVELAWIFSCLTTVPQLTRLPQYKEKSAEFKMAAAPVALLTYPLLQAADILLYKSTHVPVGEDQLQHFRLARRTAARFNSFYDTEFFPLPELVTSSAPRVKSLRNPSKKMSKSDADTRSRIELSDCPDIVREKLKKALTDMTSTVSYDPVQRPAIANLIDLHSAVTGLDSGQICQEARDFNTAQYKLFVAERIIERFEPIRREFVRLKEDRSFLQSVLNDGARRAREVARENIAEVKRNIGLL